MICSLKYRLFRKLFVTELPNGRELEAGKSRGKIIEKVVAKQLEKPWQNN